MIRYVAGRVGQAALVLWASFTLCFLLMQALPGDAILIKFQSPDLGLSAAQIADIRAAYGADSPIWLQYLHTLGNFLTGNFGYSVQAGVPVKDQLITSLPTTLWLAGTGFTLALALVALIAILSTLSFASWLREAIRALPALFISLPTFWLGIVLIQFVSFRLRLIPVIAPGPWQGLILPAITLSIPIAAPLAQILIRSIDEVLTEPFVAVVRAKGASRAWVLRKHVARNAMLPTLTIAGILLGQLISGAVVTETVFGLNGIGSLVQQAVGNQDLSVLQAIVVLSTTAFVVINLLVDLLYPVLDPRLRKQFGAAA
jgi:peptide/nickel transport system permease protein